MAGQKLSLLFLVIVFYTIISSSASISPVSSPPYLPAPGPHSYPATPSSPTPLPMSPISSPISYPPKSDMPIPLPIPSPSEPISPAVDPISYPPATAPMPAPMSYPPQSASVPSIPSNPSSPMPAPISHPFPPMSAPPMPSNLSPNPSPIPSVPPVPANLPPSPSVPPVPANLPPSPSPIPPSQGIKAAYWPSFTGFSISAIDTSYFTHLYYAFLLPDPNTYQLAITPGDEQMLPEFTSILRTQKLPAVKTMLSIGGAGNDPNVFSKIASNKLTRSIFIHSTIEVARRYRFDGLDLDWEFPQNQVDMSNLGVLFKEWRKALNKEAKATGRPRLLLTAATYFASNFFLSNVTQSYPAESIRRYVDWVNPMCYDLHGSWDTVTGAPAALYDPTSNISTSYGIHSWINAGVPARKVVMGLPLYAHTWKLKDPNVHGIGADAVGVGPGDGIMIYSEVVDFNSANNATVVYDEPTLSTYSFAGDAWIGYDDTTSVSTKIQFAQLHGLGGYFFWALGQDKDWSISRQASNAWGL